MVLTLAELGDLVRTVAVEQHVKAQIVGVIPSEGDGRYAEVFLDVHTAATGEQRMSLGFERDAAVHDLRAQIATKLADAHASKSV